MTEDNKETTAGAPKQAKKQKFTPGGLSTFPYETYMALCSKAQREPVEIPLPAKLAYAERSRIYRFKSRLRIEERVEALALIENLEFLIRPTDARGDDPATLVVRKRESLLTQALRDAGVNIEQELEGLPPVYEPAEQMQEHDAAQREASQGVDPLAAFMLGGADKKGD